MKDMETRYEDIEIHTLFLTERELDLVYNLVRAERKRVKEWSCHAQYLGQPVPAKEYEWLETLFIKLDVQHRGVKVLDG